MTTATAAPTLVGRLILARLVTVTKRSPTPKKLREEMERFFAHAPNADQWKSHLDELVEAGLLLVQPYRLTDAGRAEALAFLGLQQLPSKATWKTVRDRFLVPKALGVDGQAEELRARIATADGLRVHVLKKHFDVPGTRAAKPETCLEPLACKLICDRLGLEAVPTFTVLGTTILNSLLGADLHLDRKQLASHLPSHIVGAHSNKADHLRTAVVARWIEGDGHGKPLPLPEATKPDFDLPVFASTVQAAARDCPSGWIGDNKVFINHVWDRLRQEPAFVGFDLPRFKHHLVEANQADLLRLSRADLVQVMPHDDVQASETTYLNAVFHFILVERDRP
jgi:hypothetical protein